MKLTNTIRDAFVRAAMGDVPKVDYAEQAKKLMVEDSIDQLPTKIRAIAKDKELCHFVRRSYYYGFTAAYVFSQDDNFKPSEACSLKITELQSHHEAQRKTHESLRQKIKAVAYSVTTRKALAAALPEFEKYLPADEQAALRTVPVVQNVVSDFVKAGWPKGKK